MTHLDGIDSTVYLYLSNFLSQHSNRVRYFCIYFLPGATRLILTILEFKQQIDLRNPALNSNAIDMSHIIAYTENCKIFGHLCWYGNSWASPNIYHTLKKWSKTATKDSFTPKIDLLASYYRLGKLSAPQNSQANWKLLVKSMIPYRICFMFPYLFLLRWMPYARWHEQILHIHCTFTYPPKFAAKSQKNWLCCETVRKIGFFIFSAALRIAIPHPRSFKLLAAKRFLLVSYHIIASHIPCMNIV